jgi:hypothetical protein
MTTATLSQLHLSRRCWIERVRHRVFEKNIGMLAKWQGQSTLRRGELLRPSAELGSATLAGDASRTAKACTHKSRLFRNRWLPQTTCAGSSGDLPPPSPPADEGPLWPPCHALVLRHDRNGLARNHREQQKESQLRDIERIRNKKAEESRSTPLPRRWRTRSGRQQCCRNASPSRPSAIDK